MMSRKTQHQQTTTNRAFITYAYARSLLHQFHLLTLALDPTTLREKLDDDTI
jgi:hypothetical protein